VKAKPVKTETELPQTNPESQTSEKTKKLSGPKRSFRGQWLQQWPWLVYRPTTEDVVCSQCSEAEQQKLFTFSIRKDPSFICVGFKNWKKATNSFREHESSTQHREALMKRKSLIKV